MPVRKIFREGVAPRGQGVRLQEVAISGKNFLRKFDVTFGGLPWIEVDRAFLFDADVENRFPFVAADRFQVRFHDVGLGVEPLFDIALGVRKRIAFLEPQDFSNAGFRDFTQPEEVEDVDRGRERAAFRGRLRG